MGIIMGDFDRLMKGVKVPTHDWDKPDEECSDIINRKLTCKPATATEVSYNIPTLATGEVLYINSSTDTVFKIKGPSLSMLMRKGQRLVLSE